MSLDEHAPRRPEAFSNRLVALLAFHALLPISWVFLSRFWSTVDILVIVFICVLQFILVAAWAALGTSPLALRIVGLAIFNAYIVTVALLDMSLQPGMTLKMGRAEEAISELLKTTIATTAVCVASLIPLRYWLELTRFTNPATVDRHYQSQMGVRHLLLITFACGSVIALTGAVETFIRRSMHSELIVGAILLAPWLAGSLALAWGILSPRFAWIRLAAAVIFGLCASALGLIQFGVSTHILGQMWPAAIVFIASLFVMRSDGFRLIRRKATAIGKEEARHEPELPAVHPLDR